MSQLEKDPSINAISTTQPLDMYHVQYRHGYIKPLRAESIWENMKILLYFLSFLKKMRLRR